MHSDADDDTASFVTCLSTGLSTFLLIGPVKLRFSHAKYVQRWYLSLATGEFAAIWLEGVNVKQQNDIVVKVCGCV